MKIVAVCACPTGVAHTYMAKSSLEQAALKLGHEIKVEAQGALGIENEITMDEVKEADVVILAIEVGIAKMDRFENKPTVKVAIQSAVKSPETLLKKIEEKLQG
ncbi:PTS fructose transporter subunit IIB [Breznakia pachnodae]|uniref:Fructose-specific phosphotransferase system IIB component n=1 Tax=Breznakia pachnodae TaxID=265178 RepID=A0ABU0E091_9FIRM|nr:PTS fructose transporter subunit IIB [Breznakia pachnodae]MDQ0360303.1 fructose-specific phosphotransferase system IIB component [Breznakia pachnodae]